MTVARLASTQRDRVRIPDSALKRNAPPINPTEPERHALLVTMAAHSLRTVGVGVRFLGGASTERGATGRRPSGCAGSNPAARSTCGGSSIGQSTGLKPRRPWFDSTPSHSRSCRSTARTAPCPGADRGSIPRGSAFPSVAQQAEHPALNREMEVRSLTGGLMDLRLTGCGHRADNAGEQGSTPWGSTRT